VLCGDDQGDWGYRGNWKLGWRAALSKLTWNNFLSPPQDKEKVNAYCSKAPGYGKNPRTTTWLLIENPCCAAQSVCVVFQIAHLGIYEDNRQSKKIPTDPKGFKKMFYMGWKYNGGPMFVRGVQQSFPATMPFYKLDCTSGGSCNFRKKEPNRAYNYADYGWRGYPKLPGEGRAKKYAGKSLYGADAGALPAFSGGPSSTPGYGKGKYTKPAGRSTGNSFCAAWSRSLDAQIRQAVSQFRFFLAKHVIARKPVTWSPNDIDPQKLFCAPTYWLNHGAALPILKKPDPASQKKWRAYYLPKKPISCDRMKPKLSKSALDMRYPDSQGICPGADFDDLVRNYKGLRL
jgi:hypothetical protein